MNYAIHIGINQYDPAVYGSATLQKCVQDARDMQTVSAKLKCTEFSMLEDHAATKSAIISLLNEYAERMQPGDKLLITQSSHGTYWDTAKGRSTGLCMYDGVLWDFEQVSLWKKFREGVTIIRIIDCCFSESNFRAPFAPKYARIRSTMLLKAPNIQPTNASLRSMKASMFSLASSTVNQVSYEDQKGGVFTQAVMVGLNYPTISYAALITACKAHIKQSGYPQTPKLETVNVGKRRNYPFGL